MNLKNINRFLILFIFLFIASCQTFDNFNNKKEIVLSNSIDEIENVEIISNDIRNYNYNYNDFYTSSVNFIWSDGKELNKKIILHSTTKKYFEINPLSIFFVNDKIYYLNYESILKIYDLNNGKEINNYPILIDLNNELSYPTSVARIEDFFYAGYANGTLINFDLKGNILWQKYFNDILKTPIKIHNKNIIVLLSNKIISIDSTNGFVNWEFNFIQNIPLNVFGGTIISNNHLLYFSLPNKKLGEIDTVVGEKNYSLFSNLILDKSLPNFQNFIHNFQNSVSLFENNKYLHTIDIKNNKLVVNKYMIHNITSYDFINNALITLNKDKILKAYNINNNKIFWKIDLNDYLSKDNEIVEIINNENRLIIFFTNGLILENDYLSGEILIEQNIKIKNINAVNFYENYILVNQMNGKIFLFRQ